MQSNFDFFQVEWQELYIHAVEEEKYAKTVPRTSAFYSQISLEKTISIVIRLR